MLKRFLVMITILIVISVFLFLLFQHYNIQFLTFIVKNTMEDKAETVKDSELVKERFAKLEDKFDKGVYSEKKLRSELLRAASYIEKVEVLKRKDIDEIFSYFEDGQKK